MSPRYAHEIQTPEYGFGLEGVLRQRAGRVSGILNGVDYDEWDPDVTSSRRITACPVWRASALQAGPAGGVRAASLGPAADRHRFAVHRQKGFDLIAEVADRLLDQASHRRAGHG